MPLGVSFRSSIQPPADAVAEWALARGAGYDYAVASTQSRPDPRPRGVLRIRARDAPRAAGAVRVIFTVTSRCIC